MQSSTSSLWAQLNTYLVPSSFLQNECPWGDYRPRDLVTVSGTDGEASIAGSGKETGFLPKKVQHMTTTINSKV